MTSDPGVGTSSFAGLADLASLAATYRNAWLAAGLVAISCSVVAVYVVFRRVAFIGIATAQVAAAGVALALLLNAPPLPAAAAATLLGVALFALGREPVRVSREAMVGVAFALASALSVLFVFRSSTELDHIEHVVYGSLLFATPSQLLLLLGGAIVVVAIHALFAKEFLMASFDADTARTLGVRTRGFDLLLFATIGLVIALSIGTAGSLLTFALLILPALTALLLTQRMPMVFALSVASALAAVFAGGVASLLFDLPPGPTIVVAATALLVAAAAAGARPWLGAAILAIEIAVVAGLAMDDARDAGAAPAAAADATTAEPLHVDVELVAHDRKVERGKELEVDYVVRIRGVAANSASAELHLLLDVGSALGSARLRPGPRSGCIRIDTASLAPGRYRVAIGVWTGPPLDPTIETRLLGDEECAANALDVEIVP